MAEWGPEWGIGDGERGGAQGGRHSGQVIGEAGVRAVPVGGRNSGGAFLDYGGLVAIRLMMRWTKTTWVWMRLAIEGTNSVMRFSMGALARSMP